MEYSKGYTDKYIYHSTPYIMYKYPRITNVKIIELCLFDMDDYEYHEEYTFCIDIEGLYETAKPCTEGSQWYA